MKDSILKHSIPVSIFLLVFLLLFYPVIFSGKELPRHDIQQWRASAKQIENFREETGDEPLWTNSMFSGMPATLVSTVYWGDLIDPIFRLLNFRHPYSLILISCLCFYVLLLTFDVNKLVATVGSICYSCSSYVLIGLSAGHSSRIAAIAFLPLVVAGVHLIFKEKYRWGFILTALGLALEIKVNHLQITYYLALILVVFGVSHLIFQVKEKNKNLWTRQVPILILAVILAVGSNFGRLWNIADYGKYSTRGQSELSSSESGLEKSYIFEFSNSIFEPLVMFIPNFYGGSSSEELGMKSNLAEALQENGVPRNQISQYTKAVPTYWGKQRLTAPYYVGAIAFFLAVAGMFSLNKRTKVWLMITIGLGIILSWGDNFSSVNYFLFEYLPGYNKFRSVTFTLLLSIFGISVLASLGLNELINSKKLEKKQFWYPLAITFGFALLAAIFAGMGRFEAPVDESYIANNTPAWFIDAIRADRASLLKKDALRTALFIALAAATIYLIINQKLSQKSGLLALIGFIVLDVILVDKRYINSDSFVSKQDTEVIKTPADEFILSNTKNGDRLLNLLNPFNDATASYYHNSIGGYHGAKLGRYQDLIENHLSPEIQEYIASLQGGRANSAELGVLNMLNTRFFKFGDNPDQVVSNRYANGNAWFVSDLIEATTPLEEINSLSGLDTKGFAVIDINKFPQAAGLNPSSSTQASVSLSNYTLNRLTYNCSNDAEGLLVFSEIYYPKGWKATIDGQPADILRANYVLRAMIVPAGEHTIEFSYEPTIYASGNIIMLISAILLFVSCIGFGLYPIVLRQKTK